MEIVVWLVAGTGWMLDWASTVWPNEEIPEQNPYVVKLFGKHPDPLRFGLGKLTGLVIAGILYCFYDMLSTSFDYLPVYLFDLKVALLIPILIGLAGWHGFIHNLRLLMKS